MDRTLHGAPCIAATTRSSFTIRSSAPSVAYVATSSFASGYGRQPALRDQRQPACRPGGVAGSRPHLRDLRHRACHRRCRAPIAGVTCRCDPRHSSAARRQAARDDAGSGCSVRTATSSCLARRRQAQGIPRASPSSAPASRGCRRRPSPTRWPTMQGRPEPRRRYLCALARASSCSSARRTIAPAFRRGAAASCTKRIEGESEDACRPADARGEVEGEAAGAQAGAAAASARAPPRPKTSTRNSDRSCACNFSKNCGRAWLDQPASPPPICPKTHGKAGSRTPRSASRRTPPTRPRSSRPRENEPRALGENRHPPGSPRKPQKPPGQRKRRSRNGPT